MGKRGLSWGNSQENGSGWEHLATIGLGIIWWYVFCFCVYVHADDFAIAPQVLDDTTETDGIFSPNNDNIQDKVIIVFEMDGTTGEYQIIIDVHGPGGIGQPDGQFNADDDWSTLGKFGPGLNVNDAPKRLRIEWDGKDSLAATAKLVADGNYQLRLQVDFFQDELLNPIQESHTKTFSVTVDTQLPETSGKLEKTDFSPNNDGRHDLLVFTYNLGEDLSELQLLIPNQPTIQLTGLTAGSQSYNWNGKNGLDAVLPDGSYSLELKSTDLAGNQSTISINEVQIDTQKPTISQVVPIANTKLKTLVNELTATFEAGVGSQIDFDSSIISLKRSDGIVQDGVLNQDGMTLRLTLNDPLNLASENGAYTVNIQAVDLAGNEQVSTFGFMFDTIQPSVEKIRLNDKGLDNRSHINTSINYIEADLSDNVAGLNLFDSVFQLSKSSTILDGTQLQVDMDTIRFQLGRPLKTDGSDDGTYQISLTVVDMAGNSQHQTHPLIYDTQAPILTGTIPSNLSLDKTRIEQALTSIEVTFSDQNNGVIASGLDYNSTTITVSKSDGTAIAATKQIASITQSNIQLRFDEPLTAGDYTLSVIPIDKASNQGERVNYPFYIDLKVPEIEFTPNNEPINALTTISAQLQNYSGIGLDLAKSSLIVRDSSGETILAKKTQRDGQILVWHIANHLPKDGSRDGNYTATATFSDFEGQIYQQNLTLTVDTLPPIIFSTVPATGVKIERLKDVEVFLKDNLSGVDFSQTQVSLNSANGAVSATKNNNGVDKVQLAFTDLATDGSADGLYTMSITAVDLAGNMSGTQNIPFYFITQMPEIVSVSPVADAQVNQLSEVSATLLDYSGKGIDFDQTIITITNGQEKVLTNTSRTHTNSQVTLTGLDLPTDGSADGVYTVAVKVVDKLGSITNRKHQVHYDTQPPIITETDTTYQRLTTDQVSATFNVADTGSGIDISSSSLQLSSADGTTVSGQIGYNGSGNITYKSAKLKNDGIYTLEIVLMDQAGNISVPYTFYYTYGVEVEVANIVPRLTNDLESVVVTFKSQQNIDFSQTIFEIRNPSQQSISGEITNDGQQQMTFTPSQPLAGDGSQDGIYTITIQSAIEAIGRSNQEWTGNVIFDTQPPRVKSISYTNEAEKSIVDLQGTIVGLPTQFQMILTDNNPSSSIDSGSGIDSQQTFAQLISPVGQVSTTQSLKADTTSGEYSIFLNLNSQPKSGASVNGDYVLEVVTVDLVGNSTTYRRNFSVVWKSATIEATQPVEFSKRNELRQVDVTLENVIETEIMEMTKIRLINPDNSEISGRQETYGNTVSWILNQPLPQDGSVDGSYIIQSTVTKDEVILLSESTVFLYDTKSPKIDSVMVATKKPTKLIANQVVKVTEPFSQLTIKMTDQLAGVDLTSSTISLRTSQGLEVGTEVADNNGTIETKNNGIDTITAEFAELQLAGVYTLVVTPKDLAGNIGHISLYQISLDLSEPEIISIKIDDQLRRITAKLDNAIAALSTIEIFGTNGQVIGKTVEVKSDQIAWTPTNLLTDGTADGTYTITVTPTNKQGVSGHALVQQFTYDTQEPEISNITIVDLTQPVSYLSNPTAQIAVTVNDLGPAGLETEQQNISLLDNSGKAISAFLTHDGQENIYFTFNPPFPKDGAKDGEYQLVIDLIDKAGNKKNVTHAVFYDSNPPTLTSIAPRDGALLKGKVSQITVNLADEGGSGIDFEQTMFSVTDTDGNEVTGQISHDGKSRLIFKVNNLAQSGSYLVRIEIADRSGNVAIFESGFTNLSNLLVASSTIPSTHPTEKAFSRKQLDAISVQLPADVGNHLSTLHLMDSSGQIVMGHQDGNGSDDLQYQLQNPLKDDGSDDGNYTIVFTPISGNGQRDQPQLMSFIHDTVKPEIDEAQVRLNVSQVGINNSLISIQLLVIDPSPASGIDWSKRPLPIKVELKSFTNQTILGRTVVDSERESVTFVLNKPLASDGSQDGKYQLKVVVEDRAGNQLDWAYDFDYDTRPPDIQTSDLRINDQPLIVNANHVDYPSVAGRGGSVIITAKMNDTGGLGVDLSSSSINILSPSGELVAGSLIQNGIDLLVFSSSELLSNQGYYKVMITSVGLDPQNLGFQPTKTIGTEFLYETLPPVAHLTDSGKDKIEEGDALTLKGIASDPTSQEIPASGVNRVEIVGTGPDGKDIEPALATDTSEGGSEEWSSWKIEYLPPKSGKYVLSVRVYDKAGNAETYEKKEATFTVSLGFKGDTFCWPNPLSLSQGDNAHISFDPNVASTDTVDLTFNVYDLSGDLVYQRQYPSTKTGRKDTTIKWNLRNTSGSKVARGIYLFRLEIVNSADESANTVGKILVVE